VGRAPGFLTMTAHIGSKRYEIQPPFASSSGFPPVHGAEAGAVPAAGTGVAVTGDGRDAGGHPAALADAAWLSAPCPVPAGGIGTGAARGRGLEGSRWGWHEAGRQDRSSSGEASAAGASSREPRRSQDAAGHGDLERLLPWDAEVITHT